MIEDSHSKLRDVEILDFVPLDLILFSKTKPATTPKNDSTSFLITETQASQLKSFISQKSVCGKKIK